VQLFTSNIHTVYAYFGTLSLNRHAGSVSVCVWAGDKPVIVSRVMQCSVQQSLFLCPMPLVFNLMLHVRWAHTIRGSYLRLRVLIQSPVKGPDQCGPPFLSSWVHPLSCSV